MLEEGRNVRTYVTSDSGTGSELVSLFDRKDPKALAILP
jgi:hypothetical protein